MTAPRRRGAGNPVSPWLRAAARPLSVKSHGRAAVSGSPADLVGIRSLFSPRPSPRKNGEREKIVPRAMCDSRGPGPEAPSGLRRHDRSWPMIFSCRRLSAVIFRIAMPSPDRPRADAKPVLLSAPPADSPFRRNIPCSANENSLLGRARELMRKPFKLLRDLASAVAEAAPEFEKFPVDFLVRRESGSRNGVAAAPDLAETLPLRSAPDLRTSRSPCRTPGGLRAG
jgi:hypothetical protein